MFARALSGSVAQRKATTGLASGELGEKPSDAEKFIEDVRQALYASKIIAYAQGFNQIQAGSAEYDWGITPGDLATIWRGGCIIRAKFLNRIKEAFDEDPDLPTLIVAPYFRSAIESAIDSWRRVVVTATAAGHPDPRLLLGAVLLRRAAHRAAARRAHPGPARLLRRAHLRPHRRRPEQEVPHAVERGPQRSPRLTPSLRADRELGLLSDLTAVSRETKLVGDEISGRPIDHRMT